MSSQDRETPQDGVLSRLLSGLPEETPQIKFYPDKGPKVTADLQEGVLVLEIMALLPHERAAQEFQRSIDFRILTMGLWSEILNNGTSRITSLDQRFIKEPDASFTPYNINWPTFTMEAGLSENKAKLAIDAKGWLESAGSKTEGVITVKVDRNALEITLTRWEWKK
ncbi:hypothetical protein MGYG_00912 [Nannizzia gypsea CBS 118893]|uniref:Uncharacterized protein n=1 Tax=Arthroderma gypseum (strain ATCC MYA-4604 / CBS 118893) TaxID=535722 RepID=E5R2V3_ARTGP|nr:hypothetical protein MGYG_00912 [Nannizzia gypsea CBS 118893]EFQ97874.1 hypothetical protein MGYG_00912 [Nannizzia gypsea CBS 118893]